MASVALFHSALGLRRAVLADAERLRAAGHIVITPDLYRGRVFDDQEAARDFLESVGRDELLRRASMAVEQASPWLVYAGYSFGSGVAQQLFERRGDATGALFFFNGSALDAPVVPAPVQAHAAWKDPWVDEEEIAQLAASGAEVFRYDGGHLFADPDLPDYDRTSTELMWERVLRFLHALDVRAG